VKETINKDTYQTLKELKVSSEPYEKAITPLWKKDTGRPVFKNKSSYSLFVATPVHSECSIHYTQALLELQKLCMQKGISITFQLMKSSLVTQGRNLCVSGFLESNMTQCYLLILIFILMLNLYNNVTKRKRFNIHTIST